MTEDRCVCARCHRDSPLRTERGRCEECGDCQDCGDDGCPRCEESTPSQKPEALLTLQERNDQYVRHVFQACGGSVTNAARTLGIGRATLYRWLAKLGVSFEAREAERNLARRIKHLGRPARTM